MTPICCCKKVCANVNPKPLPTIAALYQWIENALLNLDRDAGSIVDDTQV
jgi:hypothetical protein